MWIRFSKPCYQVARILQEEGFIEHFFIASGSTGVYIWITLKFYAHIPVIHDIQLESTCSRSVNVQLHDFSSLSPGFYLISTSKGILTLNQALTHQVGGKLLCRINAKSKF